MRIGIFAGTFDPVHSGHTSFAKQAVDLGHLDKVIMVAEKNPYRKKPFASWDHRQAMIERATEDIVEADHDYQFSSQLAHSHTMKDMLTKARQHYGIDNEYWFLVGSDVFEHIPRWQDIVSRDEYGGFVVMLRDDHTEEWLEQRLRAMRDSGQEADIILIENIRPHISSRKIRDEIKDGNLPENLDAKTLDYINKHQLYEIPSQA